MVRKLEDLNFKLDKLLAQSEKVDQREPHQQFIEYECDHEGLIRRLQDLIEKKQKMIDSLTSRISTQVKVKR